MYGACIVFYEKIPRSFTFLSSMKKTLGVEENVSMIFMSLLLLIYVCRKLFMLANAYAYCPIGLSSLHSNLFCLLCIACLSLKIFSYLLKGNVHL